LEKKGPKMTLPQNDLEDELIDDEKLSHIEEDLKSDGYATHLDPPPEPNPPDPPAEMAGMATGWGAPHRPPEKGEQFSRTSEEIGRAIKDIADGTPPDPNQYPAVERIIQQNPELYARSACTPEYCQYQRNARRHPPAVSQHLIADVRPPVKERLAIVEHEVDDINQILGSHQETLSQTASRDEVRALAHGTDKQITGVYNHLTEDVVKRIDKLENKRFVRDVLWGVALLITAIYSIIMTYEVLK
jgi:hypothetical protein